MTNSEILRTPEALLKGIEKQRRFILHIMLTPAPCPNPGCAKGVNQFEALGKETDEVDLSSPVGDSDHGFVCPHCRYKLMRVIPFVAVPRPYYWVLDEPLPVKG